MVKYKKNKKVKIYSNGTLYFLKSILFKKNYFLINDFFNSILWKKFSLKDFQIKNNKKYKFFNK